MEYSFISYWPSELSLNYFDDNHCRIVSHTLGNGIERDKWNALVVSYWPSELSLNYFDDNHSRIVSHRLSSIVERDTWNAHPYHVGLLNSVLTTLMIITAV